MTAHQIWRWVGGTLAAVLVCVSLTEVYLLAPEALSRAGCATVAGALIGARIGIAMWEPLAIRAIRQSEEVLALLDRVTRERKDGDA